MGHDVTKPYVKSVTPAINASGVSVSTLLVVEFSERMRSSTLTSDNVLLYKDPLDLVSGCTYEYTDGLSLLTVNPPDLTVNTRYAACITTDAQDYYGNALITDYWWMFWTGAPSGYVHASGDQVQSDDIVITDVLDVVSTRPENYASNIDLVNIPPVLIELSSACAIGNRSYLGVGSGNINPLALGDGFFELPSRTLEHYIAIENQEVLGDPSVAHTAPTWTASPSGLYLRVEGTGWLDNNEYIVTVKKGLPGLYTLPLSEDYSFVFTSHYTPLYCGANIIRLNIGPMLQMAMAWIPDDTLLRFAYESSKQADRLHPTTIDPDNVPWYVTEYVIYQTKLNALYASIMLFAGTGAGVRKRLADLEIEYDARGLMPALLPIIEDLRKKRDEMEEMVIAGAEGEPWPVWAVKSEYDPRRPITESSWQRLPFTNVRREDGALPAGTDSTRALPWVYTNDLKGGAFIGIQSRYLQGGRYVTT